MIFTVEETTLVAAFDHSSRSAAVMDMMTQLGLIEDKDLSDQMSCLSEKRKALTDEEFGSVDFSVYEEDEDEQMG